MLRREQEKRWQIIREQKQRDARTNQILWDFNLYQEQEHIKAKQRENEAMNIMYG
jgi:hypothetical protein